MRAIALVLFVAAFAASYAKAGTGRAAVEKVQKVTIEKTRNVLPVQVEAKEVEPRRSVERSVKVDTIRRSGRLLPRLFRRRALGCEAS